jgi:hypothetical protein
LGEVELVTPHQIPAAQEPARQALVNGVIDVARCRLLGLNKDHLVVPAEAGAKSNARVSQGSQMFHVKNRRASGDLHDCLVECNFAVKSSGATRDAIAADHGGLDRIPFRQGYDQRDNANVREVYPLDRVADLIEHGPLDQFHGPEVRPQHIEISRG